MPSPLTPENTRTTLVNGTRIYLVKVARAQRMLILIVLGLLVVNIGGFSIFALLLSLGTSHAIGLTMLTAILTLNVVLAICAFVQTIRLSLASGTHIGVAGVAAFFLLIPWLGLLALLLINVYATSLLKNNAVRVGFFGVTEAEMKRLIIGACANCGYDIRGLATPQCPECGTPFAPPMAHPPGAFSPVNP